MNSIIKRSITWTLILMIVLSGALATPAPVQAGTTILVTTTDDEFGTNSNACSLREAIYAANNDEATGGCAAGSGTDSIYLEGKQYRLTLSSPGEDAGRSGDLDIRNDLTIVGTPNTSVYGNVGFPDRIFHIKPPVDGSGNPLRTITVLLSSLKISGGYVAATPGGAGLLNDTGVVLTLNKVEIRNNTVPSGITGGGITNMTGSTLNLNNSTLAQNTAGHGGGIYNGGTLVVNNSLFYANTGQTSGGGLDNASGAAGHVGAKIINSTISSNISTNATGGGAGIAVSGAVEIQNSTIADNIGIGVLLNNNSQLNIYNTILARHGSYPHCSLSTGSTLASLGYNLIGSTSNGAEVAESISAYNAMRSSANQITSCAFAATGDRDATPYLSSGLDYTQGPTGVYTFTDTSVANQAIDAIPMSLGTCPSVDQRGLGRPGVGSAGNNANCDIGSFEEGATSLDQFFIPLARR